MLAKRVWLSGASVLILSMSACTAMGPKSPDFFPNEHFSQVGPSRADADARDCMALADQYVREPNKYAEVAKQGAIGGAVGAGTGAVGGVIMQEKVGRATAAGAAVGGMIGVLKGLSEMNEKSPSYQRFVEYCLQKRGYEVTGWSAK